MRDRFRFVIFYFQIICTCKEKIGRERGREWERGKKQSTTCSINVNRFKIYLFLLVSLRNGDVIRKEVLFLFLVIVFVVVVAATAAITCSWPRNTHCIPHEPISHITFSSALAVGEMTVRQCVCVFVRFSIGFLSLRFRFFSAGGGGKNPS